jgi:hypothetical protein
MSGAGDGSREGAKARSRAVTAAAYAPHHRGWPELRAVVLPVCVFEAGQTKLKGIRA